MIRSAANRGEAFRVHARQIAMSLKSGLAIKDLRRKGRYNLISVAPLLRHPEDAYMIRYAKLWKNPKRLRSIQMEKRIPEGYRLF